MNSVHPEKNGYTNGNTQNGHTNGHPLKMEDVSAGEVETAARPEGAEKGRTSKEVQLEQVPRMGQARDGWCRIGLIALKVISS